MEADAAGADFARYAPMAHGEQEHLAAASAMKTCCVVSSRSEVEDVQIEGNSRYS